MRNVLIIEGNLSSREVLKKILEEIDSTLRICQADNIAEAYKIAMECRIDLFLIDIILDTKIIGDVSGMVFANRIREIPYYENTPLVFITTLDDYKLHSYSNLHCYSYVEKPFDYEKVKKIIEKALMLPQEKRSREYIYFRKEGLLIPQKIAEIVYVENEHMKLRIHTIDDSYVVPYRTLDNLLLELSSDLFVRCSRYIIINKEFIKSIDTVNRIIQIKGTEECIEIGAILKKKFLKELYDDGTDIINRM